MKFAQKVYFRVNRRLSQSVLHYCSTSTQQSRETAPLSFYKIFYFVIIVICCNIASNTARDVQDFKR
jgi:hypothetical protein